MWYRYKCYLDGEYVFNGILQNLTENEVVKNVKRMYGDKYEVREIERVE